MSTHSTPSGKRKSRPPSHLHPGEGAEGDDEAEAGDVAVDLTQRRVDLEGAWRSGDSLEAQTASAPGLERSHTAAATSLGAVIQASEAVEFLFSGSRSVKLPVAEELFSHGPHLATLTFEVGDPDLEPEIGISLDAGIRLGADRVRGSINLFSNSFDNFVHQRFSGEERDGLPEVIWSQASARFTGFETEVEFHLRHGAEPGYHVTLDALLDYVRAEQTETGDPLPRIPRCASVWG